MPPINIKGGKNAKRLTGKETLKILGRLLGRMFKHYPFLIVLTLICIAISSVAMVMGNLFVGQILIDDIIKAMVEGNTPTIYGYPTDLVSAILIMASIYAVGVVANYFYQILVSQIGQGTQKKIRDELFAHMELLPLSYFDSRTHGDIMSIYTNDIDTLRELISRVFPTLLTAAVQMTSALVGMISLMQWPLLLVVAIFFTIIVITVLNVSKQSSRFFIGQQMALGKTNGYIEEMISGQKVIKVFNHESQAIDGFDALNDELCHYVTKAGQFSNILGPVTNNLSNIQYIVLALTGALGIAFGSETLTLGSIISFLQLGRSFTMPVGMVAMNINMLIMAMAGAQRIFELLDQKAEQDEGYVALVNAKEGEDGNPVETQESTGRWAWKHPHTEGGVTYTWLRGKVEMNNVDFSYVPGKLVLKDVSLWAEPGQKVAFVGPTGAGKTTITNLLNRFYDIADGKIRFDGININKIRKRDLRIAMGMVLQETNLFTATVRENIRYGNPSATDEEVEKAAKLANADSFIRQLPNGYDTVLTSAGAGLSQGQRQLLSIARAACANPPALVLDEATSSIDSRTEKLVQQGMDAIMKGRTVFVIAHRLSTIQNSDVIMVLQDGSIIERGNHEALLAQKGKYYQLYTGGQVSAK